jgi:hypothetical protein
VAEEDLAHRRENRAQLAKVDVGNALDCLVGQNVRRIADAWVFDVCVECHVAILL